MELDKFELTELKKALEDRKEKLINMQRFKEDVFTKNSLNITTELLNKIEKLI